MGRTGSNDDDLPSHPNRSVDPNSRRVNERQVEGLAAELVVRSRTNNTTLKNIIDPLTDAGTVKGAATIPNTVALAVSGPSTFDGSINARGQVQFAEPGSAFNQSGKRRITLDDTGSMVLRVLQSLGEGVKAVIGNFGVTSGTTTAMSDNTWTSTTSTANHGGTFNAWVTAPDNATNPLTTVDLHAHDGFYHVSGTVTATTVEAASAGFVAVHARVQAFADTGSGYTLIGTVGSVSHTGTGAGTSTSGTFNSALSIPGTPATITVRLIAQVNVETTAPLIEPTGFTGAFSAPGPVTWTKSGGTVHSRRGVFVGSESGQPHLSFEPNTGTIITTATSTAGEVVYDGTAQQFKYNNGSTIHAVATVADVNNAVIAAGSTPRATASVTGTVRTDATETDPIVYLKVSADNLLAGKAAASHIHDDRYYVKADVDAKNSLQTYATTAARNAATPTLGLLVYDREERRSYVGDGSAWQPAIDPYTGKMSIRSFGALGDGTTNDTWAIQRALNAAKVFYGTTQIPFGIDLFAPQGRYRITAPLIAGSRLGGSLSGLGMGSSVFVWWGTGDNHRDRMMPVLSLVDTRDFTVKNIRFSFEALAYAAVVLQSAAGNHIGWDGNPTGEGYSSRTTLHNVEADNPIYGRLLYGVAVQPIMGGTNAVVSRVEEVTSANPHGTRAVGSSTATTITRTASEPAWLANLLVGSWVEYFVSGAQQLVAITANTADVITVSAWTGAQPAAGQSYRVCYQMEDQNNEHHIIQDCKVQNPFIAGAVIGHTQSKGNRFYNFNANLNGHGKAVILNRFGSFHAFATTGGGARLKETAWASGVVYAAEAYVRHNGNTYQNIGTSGTSSVAPTGTIYWGTQADGTINWRLVATAGTATNLPLISRDVIVVQSSDPCSLVGGDFESSHGLIWSGDDTVTMEMTGTRFSGDRLDVNDPVAIRTGQRFHMHGCTIGDANPTVAPVIDASGETLVENTAFGSTTAATTPLFKAGSVGTVQVRNLTFNGGNIRSITDGIIRAWGGHEFRTGNTSAMVIRKIEGMMPGMEFTVHVDTDGVTFFPGQFGLKDHAEWAAPRGSSIRFGYSRDLARAVEIARTDLPAPANITTLHADIATAGGSLFSIFDRRYHMVVDPADVRVSEIRDARGVAYARKLEAVDTKRPGYVSGSPPVIRFNGSKSLRTMVNTAELNAFGPNCMIVIVGNIGAFTVDEAFAEFSIDGSNSTLTMQRAAAGVQAHAATAGVSVTHTVGTPGSGVRVIHVRRDQISSTLMRLYGRIGSATETGHASDQSLGTDYGNMRISWGGRVRNEQEATAFDAQAVLFIGGTTNANANAVQTVINNWANAQHGATL